MLAYTGTGSEKYGMIQTILVSLGLGGDKKLADGSVYGTHDAYKLMVGDFIAVIGSRKVITIR